MRKTLFFQLLSLLCLYHCGLGSDSLSEKERLQIYKELETYHELEGDESKVNLLELKPHQLILAEKLENLDQKEILRLLSYEISLAKIDTSDIPGAAYPAVVEGLKGRKNRCGTYDLKPSSGVNKAMWPKSVLLPDYLLKNFLIPLQIHIIKESSQDNFVTKKHLDEQLKLLNEAYEPVKIQFYIEAVSDTVQQEWYLAWPDYKNAQRKEHAENMAKAMHKNQENAINIYISNPTGLWGFASFPWSDEYMTPFDNIIIAYSSLPGYYSEDGIKMEGKTLIHEMGHFLGLWHTFHAPGKHDYACNSTEYNGCSGIGDRVSDTPPQKICLYNEGFCRGSDECPVGSPQSCEICDTCPNDGSKDPTDNFMGYNIDAKLTVFTKGQVERLRNTLYYGDRNYLIKKKLKEQ
jgi:hypothetical protein